MADKKLNTRRLSFKHHHELIENQKSQEKKVSDNKAKDKKTPDPTQTSPRMISQSQKTNSPPKETILNKSRSEKQSEITAEVKSLQSRKSSSFLPEKKFRGEINLVPMDKLASDQSQKASSPSPVSTLNKSNSEKQIENTKEMKSLSSCESTSPTYLQTAKDEKNISPLDALFDGLLDDALRDVIDEQRQRINSLSTESKLNKIQPEKNNEISREMKSFNSHESLSPSILQRSRFEKNISPLDELLAEDNTFTPESLSTSPYRYPAIRSTIEANAANSSISDTLTKEPISPSSPRVARQASRPGALKFDELPEFYQDLIRQNNGFITSPKDLADLFFLVETECGKVEPSVNNINTLFRSEVKIIGIPKEYGVESINLFEVYWRFLAKESFDGVEIKKIRQSVIENYSKYREIYGVVVKDKADREVIENEIGFTVLKVIFDPLIQHLMGGDIVFNKDANGKIERQPSTLSKLLCEFIYTLDEKIINWCKEHKNSDSNELVFRRKNTFTGLIIFRGLIKIWTDEVTLEDRNSTVTNKEKLSLIKMLNSFLNSNADMFFEKIVLCSDEEKKENIQLANKELEDILYQQKIESRKKEIMHSMSGVNLPKDKFLYKTGNRNSQPYYGSVRDNLSPRHKSYSLSISEKIEHQEKEQFIDEVFQKFNIPVLLAEFKKDFKQSLLELLGREFKIFEKRPFMTCKDNLMIYLGDHREIQTKDIQGFIDKLNEEIKREVNEMEQEKRIKASSKGEDSSPRKGGQELKPEKEKE